MSELNDKPLHFTGTILQQAFDKTCDDYKMSVKERREKYTVLREGLSSIGYDTGSWPSVYPEEAKLEE